MLQNIDSGPHVSDCWRLYQCSGNKKGSLSFQSTATTFSVCIYSVTVSCSMKEITCQSRYSEWHKARRKGSRVTHHTPGEVSLASWANCWWVMMYVVEKVRLIHWMNSRDGYEQVLCTCLFCLWFRRTQACRIDEENPAIARPATCVAPSTVWNLNAAYEKMQAALCISVSPVSALPSLCCAPLEGDSVQGHLIELWGLASSDCSEEQSPTSTAMSTAPRRIAIICNHNGLYNEHFTASEHNKQQRKSLLKVRILRK